jgi:CheY-specific phosphatase CheX
MGSDEGDAMDNELLISQSVLFSESVRDCFRDMLGAEIVLDSSNVLVSPFSPSRPMVALIHFTGAVQGDYVLSLEEETAAKLIGAWSEGMDANELKGLRPDFGGMLKEVLNTAVGMAIPKVEDEFGRLTYHPPMIVYGSLDTPNIPCGTLTLGAEAGLIDCTFVLDKAGTDAEKMLLQAMDDLRRARQECDSYHKVLQRLTEQPSGGLIIDELIQSAKLLLEEWDEVDAAQE